MISKKQKVLQYLKINLEAKLKHFNKINNYLLSLEFNKKIISILMLIVIKQNNKIVKKIQLIRMIIIIIATCRRIQFGEDFKILSKEERKNLM